MNKNIIGIDPSLISTGLVIGNNTSLKLFNYCREDDANGKKGMRKWFKLAENLINYKYIHFRGFDSYSEGEIIKLIDYDKITDKIVSDILENIDTKLETIIGIEGYSFGSTDGDLIDLVTFSALLRKKLYDKVTKNIIVLSPSTLKKETAKLTYDPIIKIINKGKKNEREEYTWRNNLGVSGGSFQKPDMYRAIIENKKFDDKWFKHSLNIKEDMLIGKKINKPYEDVNDAYLLYQVIKNGYQI